MPVYVQHEVLGKVHDVFNAESIWQAPGLALFSRRPLLRDLLERSPRELRGRAPTRCFSHVTLLLAQEELDDDRHLTRGARVRDLAESLTALHRKDFGDLLGGDDVRYQVIGTDALAPGQVEVKFGHAVYLPTAGETPQYLVETSLDSAVSEALLAEFAEIDLPFNAYYGDGSPFAPDELEEVRAAYRHETFMFDWQRGDLLMLDNMLAAHGRAPFAGARKIVVRMADPLNWTDLEVGGSRL